MLSWILCQQVKSNLGQPVACHLNSVFRKLGVSSRDELRDVLVELGRPTAGGQT